VPLPGPMELSIVMGLPCILWVGMAVVACILGWNALGRIRRAWPNLYGVGGATVGAWIGPLLLLDLIVLFAVVSFAGSIGVTSTPFLALMTVIVLLSLNGGFMLWYRERFLERCRKQASA